jgi:hypothetical protein
VIPRVSTSSPSAGSRPEQVAGRDHRGQGPFGAAAPLEQPVREVGTRPQLWDRELHRSGAVVPLPRPGAVAGVDPLVAAGPGRGPADGIGGHQRLDERLEQGAQQVRFGTLELLGKDRFRPDAQACKCSGKRSSPPASVPASGLARRPILGSAVIVMISFRSAFAGLLKDHAVTVFYVLTTRHRRGSRTPRPWTQLRPPSRSGVGGGRLLCARVGACLATSSDKLASRYRWDHRPKPLVNRPTPRTLTPSQNGDIKRRKGGRRAGGVRGQTNARAPE